MRQRPAASPDEPCSRPSDAGLRGTGSIRLFTSEAFDLYDGIKDGIGCECFGTSMAAPQVAGALAVLRQSRPTATSDQMVAALQRRGVAVTDSRNGITRT